MADALDILIRRARLRDGRVVDIAIREGRIHAIEPAASPASSHASSASARSEIDAQGNLVTESFVNPHLHLDKVFTLEMQDEAALREYHSGTMGGAMTAIELAARVKDRYDQGWILENARRALHWAIGFGSTHIRAFTDVDSKARLEGVKALLRAREEFEGRIDVQVVAFPQDGMIREPGAADLVREAMALGADVVGGIPWIEYTDTAAQQHVDQVFAIARQFNRPVSMLVDDAGDPGLRTLEMQVTKALEMGWQGRTLAHHARAMQLYPRPYLAKVAALMNAAEMGVVMNPHTGPLHVPADELQAHGVLVCLGQDDISDAYYPYGRNNMLEVAFLASHILWWTAEAKMQRLYDMITVDAARAIGLRDFRLGVGAPAHLVVLDVPTVPEALRHHAKPAHVISHGRIVV